jgi:hypothetical protein
MKMATSFRFNAEEREQLERDAFVVRHNVSGTSLVAEAIDERMAVPAPVAVGGAGPNTTERMRRAHICEWQLPPRPRATRAERPWVEEGHRGKAAMIAAANKR